MFGDDGDVANVEGVSGEGASCEGGDEVCAGRSGVFMVAAAANIKVRVCSRGDGGREAGERRGGREGVKKRRKCLLSVARRWEKRLAGKGDHGHGSIRRSRHCSRSSRRCNSSNNSYSRRSNTQEQKMQLQEKQPQQLQSQHHTAATANNSRHSSRRNNSQQRMQQQTQLDTLPCPGHYADRRVSMFGILRRQTHNHVRDTTCSAVCICRGM